MSEGLQTLDGKPLDLEAAEQAFNAAMAAPESEVPAPRKMTAEAKAAVKDSPRKPPKPRTASEKARTTTTSQKSDKDFTEDLQGITTGLWLTAASVPYTQAYAALVKLNQPALVAQLNQAAKNNATVRTNIEKLSSGGGGMWMLGLGVTAANMSMQALQIARDPELRKQMAEQTRADLQQFLKDNGLVAETPKVEKAPDGQPY